MAYPEFVIPQQLQELLTNAGNNYCVQRVLNIKDIKTNLVGENLFHHCSESHIFN